MWEADGEDQLESRPPARAGPHAAADGLPGGSRKARPEIPKHCFDFDLLPT